MSYQQHKKIADTRARKRYAAMERAIEIILEHPEKKRSEQAALMGVSPAVFSGLVNDPAFESIRQERVAQIVDPVLRESLEHGLLKTSLKAVQIVEDRLGIEPTIHDALSTLKVTTQALGMANRKSEPAIQNTIQIAWMPATDK